MKSVLTSLGLLFTSFAAVKAQNQTNITVAPVALFHGVGSSCNEATNWVTKITDGINNVTQNPNATIVKCVEIGNGKTTSMFEKMDWQIHQACHSLRNDPDYAGKEINIVGISQGGLISRSIVEKCEGLEVHTLFTYGAPHQGVSAYQLCRNWYCWPLNWLAGYMVQYHIIETFGAPTDYFRTWWNLDRYYENSIFLPYVNNEIDVAVMPSYKDNISRLTNCGLFMWTDDEVVHPKQSEWFGVYNEYRMLVDIYDTKLYRDDTIGLKTLNNAGKLFFYSGPGIHMTLTDQYINQYLIPLLADGTPSPSEH